MFSEILVKIGAEISRFEQAMGRVSQLGASSAASVTQSFDRTSAALNHVSTASTAAATGVDRTTQAMGRASAGGAQAAQQLDMFGRMSTAATGQLDLFAVTAVRTTSAVAGMGTRLAATAAISTDMAASLQRLSPVLMTVSMGLAAIGAAATGGLVLGIKAAANYEQAFAGIRKTVDATEQEFGELSNRLRQMAKDTPIAANELAHIGELAGQLGVRGADNLTKFMDTVAKLGVATTLSTEEAATSLAQLANIMQEPIGNVDRMAASLVDLGNKSATTEAKILDFAMRISPVAGAIGMTTAQVFGISAAFASVGLNAEAGGTAIQRVLGEMNAAVVGGTATLDLFGQVAANSGNKAIKTGEDFKRMFSTNPVEAFKLFVEGLGRSGKQATLVLEALGLDSERTRTAFLAASNAAGILDTKIQQSTKAWAENIAHTEEFRKKSETLISQLKILYNRVYDFGITLGGPFIEGLKLASKALGTLVNILGAIPGLPQLVGVFLGVAGAVALSGAAFTGFMYIIARSATQWAMLFNWLTRISGASGLGAMIPGLTRLSALFGTLSTAMSGGIVAAFTRLAAIVGSFAASLFSGGGFLAALAKIGALLSFILNPVGLTIAAFVALAAGLTYFFAKTEMGQKAWAALTDSMYVFALGIVGYMKDVWGGIVAGVSYAYNAVAGFFSGLWSVITEWAASVVDKFKGVGSALIEWLIPTGLKDATVSALGWFDGMLTSASSKIQSFVGSQGNWWRYLIPGYGVIADTFNAINERGRQELDKQQQAATQSARALMIQQEGALKPGKGVSPLNILPPPVVQERLKQVDLVLARSTQAMEMEAKLRKFYIDAGVLYEGDALQQELGMLDQREAAYRQAYNSRLTLSKQAGADGREIALKAQADWEKAQADILGDRLRLMGDLAKLTAKETQMIYDNEQKVADAYAERGVKVLDMQRGFQNEYDQLLGNEVEIAKRTNAAEYGDRVEKAWAIARTVIEFENLVAQARELNRVKDILAENKYLEQRAQLYQGWYEEMRQATDTEEARTTEQYAKLVGKLQVSLDQGLIDQEEYNRRRLKLDDDYYINTRKARAADFKDANDKAAADIRLDEEVLDKRLGNLRVINDAQRKHYEQIGQLNQQMAMAVLNGYAEGESRFAAFGRYIKGVLQEVYSQTKSVMEGIGQIIRDVFTNASRVLEDVFFDMFTGNLKSAKEYFDDFLNSMLRSLSRFLAEQAVRTLLKLLVGGESGGGGGDGLMGMIGNLFGGGSGIVSSIIGAVMGSTAKASGGNCCCPGTGTGTGEGEGQSGGVGGILGWAVKAVSKIWELLTATDLGTRGDISGIGGGTGGTLSDLLRDQVGSPPTGSWESFDWSQIDSSLDWGNLGIDWSQVDFGLDLGSVPIGTDFGGFEWGGYMAEGGLVSKPTMAIIGEKGPELVIPTGILSALWGLYGLAGTIMNPGMSDAEKVVSSIGTVSNLANTASIATTGSALTAEIAGTAIPYAAAITGAASIAMIALSDMDDDAKAYYSAATAIMAAFPGIGTVVGGLMMAFGELFFDDHYARVRQNAASEYQSEIPLLYENIFGARTADELTGYIQAFDQAGGSADLQARIEDGNIVTGAGYLAGENFESINTRLTDLYHQKLGLFAGASRGDVTALGVLGKQYEILLNRRETRALSLDVVDQVLNSLPVNTGDGFSTTRPWPDTGIMPQLQRMRDVNLRETIERYGAGYGSHLGGGNFGNMDIFWALVQRAIGPGLLSREMETGLHQYFETGTPPPPSAAYIVPGRQTGVIQHDLFGRPYYTQSISDGYNTEQIARLATQQDISMLDYANWSQERLSFGTGGLVTRPVRALLAEDGPEVVMPIKSGYQYEFLRAASESIPGLRRALNRRIGPPISTVLESTRSLQFRPSMQARAATQMPSLANLLPPARPMPSTGSPAGDSPFMDFGSFSLPGFANGGTVYNPMFAQVGEGRYPELIARLADVQALAHWRPAGQRSLLRPGMASGWAVEDISGADSARGQVVNIAIHVHGDVKDPRQLARELAPILRDELNRNDARRSQVSGKREF